MCTHVRLLTLHAPHACARCGRPPPHGTPSIRNSPSLQERLDKRMSELVQTVAKMEIPADRRVCVGVCVVGGRRTARRARREGKIHAQPSCTCSPLLYVCRSHFDVVVACEDENGGCKGALRPTCTVPGRGARRPTCAPPPPPLRAGDDLDVPLLSIKFRG